MLSCVVVCVLLFCVVVLCWSVCVLLVDWVVVLCVFVGLCCVKRFFFD